jgi:flagellar biosynthetic protein FliP
MPSEAIAQAPGLDGLSRLAEGSAAGRVIQLAAALTLLSVAPALLVMVTSFTRFAIAFAFLRSGLGLQSTPGNMVLVSLALCMTYYTMAPTFERAWRDGGRPLLESRISEAEALPRLIEPFKEFMRSNVRDRDLRLFADLAAERAGGQAQNDADDLRTLIPAFMISELRRGFEIGFLVVLPFLVIDLVVAALVMSMGMMMVSPVVFSLPCKVLFFVLIDGWHLLVGGLVRSVA